MRTHKENVKEEMTANERTTHERTVHATNDPRCETCVTMRGVSTHPREAAAEAAYFDCATVKVNKVQKARAWLVLDRREPYIEREQNSKISNCS